MRSKRVAQNAIVGLSYQIIMLIYGLVIPRLFIGVYGSSVNGLLQSIAQFLSYITLMDAGVSAVIRSKFYKPLADRDKKGVQGLLNAAKKFYRKVAGLFIIYMVIIAFVLPKFGSIATDFDYTFTLSLVFIIGISTFAEYFFGISYTVLLEADQKKYLVYLIQSVSVILNMVVCILLINHGASVHVVKLSAALFYSLRPILLVAVCNKIYKLDKTDACVTPVEHQWDGMGHHLAYFLHSHTDIVILTLAKGTKLVSVYSVYNMVTSGLVSLTVMLTGGIEAAFGNMIAKKESKSLSMGFDIYELCMYSISTILFTTAAVMTIPFVKIYTYGVTDINYIRPMSAYVLIAAQAMYCIRQPYQSLTMAAGKFRETMAGAFEEAAINIILSLLLVWKYGITGVAIGTLAAMSFRTIQYVFFLSKNILERKVSIFFKKILSYWIVGASLFGVSKFYNFEYIQTYHMWFFVSLIVFCICSLFVLLLDVLLYRNALKAFLERFKGLVKKK